MVGNRETAIGSRDIVCSLFGEEELAKINCNLAWTYADKVNIVKNSWRK